MEHNETDDTTVCLPEATNETNSTIASPQHPENQHFPRAKASPVSSQHSHRPAKAMAVSTRQRVAPNRQAMHPLAHHCASY